MGCHSLTTTSHPPNVSLPSSGQQVTSRLSARKVSVTEGKGAQDPLVRDTTVVVEIQIVVLWVMMSLDPVGGYHGYHSY